MKSCFQSSPSPSAWTLKSLVLFSFLLALVVNELPTVSVQQVEAFAVVRQPPSSSTIAAPMLLHQPISTSTRSTRHYRQDRPREHPTTTATTSALRLAPIDHADHAHALVQTIQSTTTMIQPQWIAAVEPHWTAFLPPPPPPPTWLIQAWDAYGRLLREQPVRTKAATAAALCFLGDAVAQLQASSSSSSSSNTGDNHDHDDDHHAAAAAATTNYSVRRGLAFAVFGALYTGAFQHHWFQFLQRHCQDWGEALHLWGHPAATDIPVRSFLEISSSSNSNHHNSPEWWRYFDLKRDIDTIVDTLQDPPSPLALAAAQVALNQFFVVPCVYMPLFFVVTGAVAGLDWNKMQARARSLYMPLLRRNYLFWLPVQTVQFWVVPPDYQVPFVCVASLCWTVVLSSIGGSAAPSASPSSIVAYQKVVSEPPPPPAAAASNDETEAAAPVGGDLQQQAHQQQPEPVYQVLSVDAGAANEITDDVLWEDVRDAVVPRDVREAVGDVVQEALTRTNNNRNHPQVGAGAGGLALGLLASAADEAAIGATLGSALGAGEDLGIAVVAAVGAGAGILVSRAVHADERTKDDDDVDDDDTGAWGANGDDDEDDKQLPVVVASVESETKTVDLEVNHTNSTSVAGAPTTDWNDSAQGEQQEHCKDAADRNLYAKDHFEDSLGASLEHNNETGSKPNVLTESLKR